jgi:hypothetical protein
MRSDMNVKGKKQAFFDAGFAALAAGVVLMISQSSAQDVKLKVPLGKVFEPVYVYTHATNGGVLLTEPDGKTVRFFYRLYPKVGEFAGNEGTGSFVYEDTSTDGGATWKLQNQAFETGDGSQSDVAYVNPYSGEIYWTYRRNGQGRLIRTANSRTDWNNDIEIPFSIDYDGGNFIWLKDKENTGFHRIVFVAKVQDRNGTASYYSDDDGDTWQGPSELCSAPPYEGRWDNRGSSGHVVELNDGRLWMLLRNSQDHLWEYFSMDRGETWSQGRPSRFVGVFSCVRLYRIPDGRLMIVWLHSMPRSGVTKTGSFHNTARDVVHAAISDDDGKTWRGFREVVLGKRRHSLFFSYTPAYDAGIHHQKFTVTKDNKALVFTGQDDKFVTWDTDHRQVVIFDIDWLYATSRSTDFSHEYDELSVFKLSQKRWRDTNYYSRVMGATLIGHPTQSYKKVLHLGREKCDWIFNEQDGANWNFPAGKMGSLETSIQLRSGFQGGAISLVNVFYPPSDNAGDTAAMYRLDIPPDGRISASTTLEPETWYDVKLEWNGTAEKKRHSCKVYINGSLQPEELPLNNISRDGVCYVRFRSTAQDEDLAGWLVEHIKADVVWEK